MKILGEIWYTEIALILTIYNLVLKGLMFFGAERQRQNVLKFGIFPFSIFRDMVVQSRSSQN